MRRGGCGCLGCGALLFVTLAILTGSVGVLAGDWGGLTAPRRPEPAAAVADIPTEYLALYSDAGRRFGLDWPVLAAVGRVESDHGRLTAACTPNEAGAIGPMQFLPASFSQAAEWADLADADICDPVDAIPAAAAYLRHFGAPDDWRRALYAYNHSAAYVTAVLAKAADYATATAASDPGPGRTVPGDGAAVVAFALTQLGVPYVWGGDTAGVALDCSGLVQVAYRAAGVALPRTTFEQASYGTTVAITDLRPGDLLFFRGGDPVQDLGHVAIYAGNGTMISAPHTGAVVQIEPVPYDSIELARRVLEGS